MKTINLRDYYYYYKQDEFVEVSDEVAEALLKGKREQHNYIARVRYHKAYYSLDVGDGIECAAVRSEPTPEQLYEYKLTMQQLCNALNSLPEIQGRRVDAHYLLGMKKVEIAKNEGVTDSCVCESIKKGINSMKKYFEKFDCKP